MDVATFNPQQQHRVETVDRTLQTAMRQLFQAVQTLKHARQAFIAQGLNALWPDTADGYVHNDRDASTRAEQTEMGNFALHALQSLLNEGAGGGLTDAQAAAILNRYAGR